MRAQSTSTIATNLVLARAQLRVQLGHVGGKGLEVRMSRRLISIAGDAPSDAQVRGTQQLSDCTVDELAQVAYHPCSAVITVCCSITLLLAHMPGDRYCVA